METRIEGQSDIDVTSVTVRTTAAVAGAVELRLIELCKGRAKMVPGDDK